MIYCTWRLSSEEIRIEPGICHDENGGFGCAIVSAQWGLTPRAAASILIE